MNNTFLGNQGYNCLLDHSLHFRKDVGKRMLYRDAHMTGWAYKEIQPDDLKFPVVYGEGKRSRLLATIGVTRGFGDHDLKAQSSNGQTVYIKPFLTPQPEVRVLDIENEDINESDVLVMATDGLWDVVSNERVADIIHNGMVLHSGNKVTPPACSILSNSDDNLQNSQDDNLNPNKKLVISDEVRKKYRFISIAQELVMAARGKLVDRNWRRNVPIENGTDSHDGNSSNANEPQQMQQVPATIDDISVFVIPILAYKEEYLAWKQTKLKIKKSCENDKQSDAQLPEVKPKASENSSSQEGDNAKTQYFANGELEKSVNRLSDTSDSDKEFERDASSDHFEKPLYDKNEARSTEHREVPSDSTLNNGKENTVIL